MSATKTILLIAALGTALVLANTKDRLTDSLPVQSSNAPPSQVEIEHASLIARCGVETKTGGMPFPMPLTNDYMSANGRVFSIGGFVACANRLHASRVS